MSLADINRRLKNRYKLLTDGSAMLEERQQTLRALVDWSYDMLAPADFFNAPLGLLYAEMQRQWAANRPWDVVTLATMADAPFSMADLHAMATHVPSAPPCCTHPTAAAGRATRAGWRTARWCCSPGWC